MISNDGSVKYGELRFFMVWRMFATFVASTVPLTLVAIYSERGWDYMTIGILITVTLLFLGALIYWWRGVRLYRKLEPHLNSKEVELWREASIQQMKGLLRSIELNEQQARKKVQELYALAARFPDLEKSRKFKSAVRILDIRTCEFLVRIATLEEERRHKQEGRKASRTQVIEQLKQEILDLGVSKDLVAEAASIGEAELRQLLSKVKTRKELLRKTEVLGVTSLAQTCVKDDLAYSNFELVSLIERVDRLRQSASAIGVLDQVVALLHDKKLTEATRFVEEAHECAERVRICDELREGASHLAEEELRKFVEQLEHLRGLIESPRKFRIALHDIKQVFRLA